MWILESRSPAQTRRFGHHLASTLVESMVVALVGDLGSGKTCLAKGIAEGLDIEEEVVSPTFILVSEYEGRRPLLHADVYRLEEEELDSIGLEEQLETWPGLALVEWADRFEDLVPTDHIRISLEDLGSSLRRICVEGGGARSLEMVSQLREGWEALGDV
jgi:tRNA threonylcarbamoyladenosine biosynthesis protein TsaE